MPKVNFQNVEEAEDYSPLPDGAYFCRLAAVGDNNRTQAGDEMWDLRFTVERGEHRGRHIYDRISFGPKALSRVKLVCSRLGIDVSGPVNVTPGLILGKVAYVTVETEEYTDKNGKERLRNTVPFAGYAEANGADAPQPAAATRAQADTDDDDLPF